MCLNAFLLYDLDGLLPGAGAGAEAMGRARVTVIAPSVANPSHVTAPLLYSLFSLCEAARGRNPHDPLQIKAAEADGASMYQQLYHDPRARSPKHGNEEQLICGLWGEACLKVISLSHQINNECTVMV